MKKILKVIIAIIIYAIIFGFGFAVGMYDKARRNTIEITGVCSGNGVMKSMTAVYESRDGVVIRDERVETAIYTTTCNCIAADRNHDATTITSVELSSSDVSVHENCASVCDAYCASQLVEFKFTE